MQDRYTRRVGFGERMWIVADRLCKPVLNQMIVEGSGSIDEAKWREAIAIASEANPGSRLILKGFLNRCRWLDSGSAPPIREVDGAAWDGTGPDNAPFLQDTFDLKKGPTCEVLVIEGKPLRIAFRTHHSVMDGRGTLTWVEDIFRALRGEEVLGSDERHTDYDIAKFFFKRYRKPFPHDNLAPTGRPDGEERGATWHRRSIPGKFSKLLPKVAVIMAREARQYGSGKVRFGVPADLRPRIRDYRSTANLTAGIYIDVEPDATPETVADDIRRQFRADNDVLIDKWDFLLFYVPLWMMHLGGKQKVRQKQKKGIYSISGVLTNMGRIPLEKMKGGGFNPDTVFFIPPPFEYTPCVMAFSGTDAGAELVFSAPLQLATGGRLERLMDNIVDGLQGD